MKIIGLGDLVKIKSTGAIGIIRRDHSNGMLTVSLDGSVGGGRVAYRDECEILDNAVAPSVWRCALCKWWNFGHETDCTGCQTVAYYGGRMRS